MGAPRGFAYVPTDVMYGADGDRRADPAWTAGSLTPLQDLSLSPAAAVLSYGLGVFEGLKIRRDANGRLLAFRAQAHGERFARSAQLLRLLPFPVEQFVDAVMRLSAANAAHVPATGKGALYLRPMLHAVEAKLGIGPCDLHRVTIYASPVGAFFGGDAGVRLRVLSQPRVPAGGTGAAKALSNYAAALHVAQPWKDRGFSDVLYLDSSKLRYVTETGGSNVVAVMKDGSLVTPPLDDQILPGVTRDSALHLARESLGLVVHERPLALAELLSEAREVFCTGTAWTVRSVQEIAHDDGIVRYEHNEVAQQVLSRLRQIQRGESEDPFGWIQEVSHGA